MLSSVTRAVPVANLLASLSYGNLSRGLMSVECAPVCLGPGVHLDWRYVGVFLECGHWCALVGAGNATETLVLECDQRPEGVLWEAFSFLSASPYPVAVGDGRPYHRRIQGPGSCEGEAPGGANQVGEGFQLGAAFLGRPSDVGERSELAVHPDTYTC